MTVCSASGCVGLATKGDKCAIHGAVYVQANGAGLRCSNCRRLFAVGEWYQVREGGQFHAAKACETHPDVIEAREREASGRRAPMRAGRR